MGRARQAARARPVSAAVAIGLCAGVATVLLTRPRGVAASGSPTLATGRSPAGLPPAGMAVVAVLGALALMTVLGAARLGLLAGVVALVAAERRRGRRRDCRLKTAQHCEEYVMALAAEMSAGRAPAEALAAAASLDVPGADDAARVSALGGDAAVPLRRGSTESGASSLRHVAAAWQLAGATGAPLADVLRRTSLLVRDEVAAIHEVEEQMAPVRATGRVLALLPLMGVLIGGAFGVNVPAVLLGTTWGQMCLLAALGLVSAGLWVIDRIGDRAARA